jgi:hypothetical protein
VSGGPEKCRGWSDGLQFGRIRAKLIQKNSKNREKSWLGKLTGPGGKKSLAGSPSGSKPEYRVCGGPEKCRGWSGGRNLVEFEQN